MENKNTFEEIKNRETAGADEQTPSKAQYFSWINNTNEGATEEHTLINLEYFKWLRDEYGMQLDIYAWDAGNLDGSRQTYETLDSPKLTAQYPNGYGACAEAARKIGAKLGVWCGPDGFGNTPEEAEARHELMVSLCRDYNFGLFKMDAVCGKLREDKQDEFVRMMKECRKYSPELILLNHRLNLGKGMPYATTFLWNGIETYIDVHVSNHTTAPHHREYMFHRGNVPGLLRLSEDHGVCISSCIDYFEDDLIYQAFGRSLILAPEIYGNPWFLRDDEQAKLARIYNLHRTYRDILVKGTELPETYGSCAVSRGNDEVRFITSGNPSWDVKKVLVNINEEIGIKRSDGEFTVSLHHPYERHIGTCRFGDRIEVEIEPFRAILIEVAQSKKAYPMLTGCSYEVLHETNGVPDKVKILKKDGNIKKLVGGVLTNASTELNDADNFDNTLLCPVELSADFVRGEIPENIEQLFEVSQFAIDNDSLEARAVRRSGETSIPQVKAARDAFFGQRRYKARGCESAFAFDGNEDTYFGSSISPFGGVITMGGGCLRVDFGDIYDADLVMIEYFEAEQDDVPGMPKQILPNMAHSSTDLGTWKGSYLDELVKVRHEVQDRIIFSVHNIVPIEGSRKRVYYKLNGKMRYFRLPHNVDRVSKIALIKDGEELELKCPRVSNIMASFKDRKVMGYRSAVVKIPSLEVRDGSYLAIGINGKHGCEGVYITAELDGVHYGCPDRASSYKSNVWESVVTGSDGPYTYYLPLDPKMLGRELKIHVIEMTDACAPLDIDIHLCEPNDCRDGIISEF